MQINRNNYSNYNCSNKPAFGVTAKIVTQVPQWSIDVQRHTYKTLMDRVYPVVKQGLKRAEGSKINTVPLQNTIYSHDYRNIPREGHQATLEYCIKLDNGDNSQQRFDFSPTVNLNELADSVIRFMTGKKSK